MRRFFVDTLAMIIFFTIVGMVIEIFVSGMTLGQSVHARLIAIPANLLTARLYGMFRDKVFQATRANQRGQVGKGLTDILTFAIFQVPLYAAILGVSGASARQIITACSTIAILSAFMGRPSGIFLDFCRWLFKIEKQSSS